MIPDELRSLPQWVAAGGDKEPINPRTGHRASVVDSSTWGTYEEATASGLPHVGFVLTEEDPYAFVDLDRPLTSEQAERHTRIFQAFPSYAELSQSRQGIHIVCRGRVPSGAKRDRVEVYSFARYMICTGNVVRAEPIVDCQSLLDVLYAEMHNGNGIVELEEHAEIISDRELVEMASRAANGEKFDRLCNGQWEGEYPSQSEADFALLAILAFYTRSNQQVIRLFRMSRLGKREKAWRDEYLLTCLRKIRSNEPERLDFSTLNLEVPDATPPLPASQESADSYPDASRDRSGIGTATAVHDLPPVGKDLGSPTHPNPQPNPQPEKRVPPAVWPPGFVGELARYIYDTAQRPVVEVGIAASIALCAGIMGRQFNISGTGLNQYIILLATTGSGKEGGPSGIDRLVSAVRPNIPLVDSFIGPATFASGPGLLRAVDKQPCFVSILGEFGLWLQSLSQNDDSLTRAMRRALLDLYTKSGRGAMLRPSAYSDTTKNTNSVESPALTLLGESTPEVFYSGLSLQQIADGLVPRFLIIEYTGDRPRRNRHAFTPPPEHLVARLTGLVSTCLQMQANQSWVDVELGAEAKSVLEKFDELCDEHMRSGGNEGIRQLWNRAHLKALRLAALLAAADRPHVAGTEAGGVTREEAEWSVALVLSDSERLMERFARGDIGEGESKQIADVERVLKDYLERPLAELETYGVTRDMHSKRVVPHVYLSRRTSNLSAFRKHRLGARLALQETIKELVRNGRLVEIDRAQMKRNFATTQQAYHVPV